MKRLCTMARPASLLVALAVVAGCTVTQSPAGMAPESPTDSSGPSMSSPSAVIAAVDCTADSLDCPELVIEGDEPYRFPNGAESPFHGMADPSIRFDPTDGRLWLAYSWPHLHLEGQGRFAVGVESHLAFSDDRGSTWTFHSVLWPSIPMESPDGLSGYLDHEVPNLLPVTRDGSTTWYGARLNYFATPDGESARSSTPSFRIAVMAASTPPGLSSAEPTILGSAATDPAWNIDVDLSELHPEVAGCALWNEPALHEIDGELFLALRCLFFPRGSLEPDLTRSGLAVFSTDPVGDPRSWDWSYRGMLATGVEAAELGGEGLTQLDFAFGIDGALLAIVTPDTWDSERLDFIHHGCRVVEVESLTQPAFARNPDGSLRVRAVTDATDTYPLGPAACAYDPVSETGLLMTRRIKIPGELTASMHATFLKP